MNYPRQKDFAPHAHGKKDREPRSPGLTQSAQYHTVASWFLFPSVGSAPENSRLDATYARPPQLAERVLSNWSVSNGLRFPRSNRLSLGCPDAADLLTSPTNRRSVQRIRLTEGAEPIVDLP